jgi:hypothetical protein
MKKLLAKLWHRKQEATEPELSDEEKRHVGDVAKLAEIQAFDTAVGAMPTPQTLSARFADAVMAGHTKVVADTLEKGAEIPHEIVRHWLPPYGAPMTMVHKPLYVAASREWADMVDVLLKGSDEDNLKMALHAAETQQNIGIARAIHGEIARRANPGSAPAAEDPMALQTPVKVSKPLSLS